MTPAQSAYEANQPETDVSENTEQIRKYDGRANLIPWQPGQSGNPGGRPRKKPITEAYERLMQDPEAAMEIAQAMFDVVKSRGKGTVFAAKELTDRLEGKVAESVEHSGANGGPVAFTLTIIGEK